MTEVIKREVNGVLVGPYACVGNPRKRILAAPLGIAIAFPRASAFTKVGKAARESAGDRPAIALVIVTNFYSKDLTK